ncbi:MAG: hypothetical protein ACFE88_16105, partial [Candidatus Hermodarchaeota archaeon]
MFIEYFYYLKERLSVSITEYMTLMEALNQGLIHNMVEFYYISRSILCKSEHQFDIYDIAFANFFKEAMLKFPEDIKQEIWDWLNKEITLPELIEGLQLLLREYQEYINIENFEQFLEELLEKYGAEFGDKLIINAPNEIKDEIWKWLEKNFDMSEIQGNFQEMI